MDSANSVRDGSILECDLAIVGAGPAGLTIGRELSRSKLDVLVLDAGGRGTQFATESKRQPTPFGTYDLKRNRGRGFGGTSGLFLKDGWRARPLDPSDLKRRVDFPLSGWPLEYEALLPYLRRAQTLLDLGEYDWDGLGWAANEREPQFILDDPDFETSVFRFCDPDIFRNWGSELEAWPTTKVLLDAVVTRLLPNVDGTGVAEAAVCSTNGGRFKVRARSYVLATGGIDNPRLMLASGVGNENDLVGRYFMEHFHVQTGVMRPTNRRLAERMEFYKEHSATNGLRIQGALRLADGALDREGLLNSLVWLFAVPRVHATKASRSASELLNSIKVKRRPLPVAPYLANCLRDPLPLAVRALNKALGHPLPDGAAIMMIESEQLPNPESRVTLGRELDPYGVPLPRLNWKVTDLDLRSIRRTQELFSAALERNNLGRLEELLGDEDPPAHVGGGAHHMGTTRMHASPRKGVVDPNGRVHGMGNLFVTGSSVFPTAGASNPTFTIVALAIRLADHLRRELGNRSLADAG